MGVRVESMSDPSRDDRYRGAGVACAIGNFDGVHRGHQAVLSALHAMAAARGLAPTLLTFEPHPAVTLGRDAPARLTTLPRKTELAERLCDGIAVVARAFTLEFSELSAEAFAREVLRDGLDARLVMVGRDFRFGHRRLGTFAELERLGGALGFSAVAQPLLCEGRGVISSTRIRASLAAGEVEDAGRMLGRPHMISGHVGHGDARGRTLGFPTCNLAGVVEAVPQLGVYAVLVDRCRAGRAHALARGVANIGRRPTVTAAHAPVSLEVHLLDFAGDVYGEELRVHLVARLRVEQRFPDIDALRAQIARDAARARELLASAQPDPGAGGGWF